MGNAIFLTDKQVAAIANVSRSYISALFAGKVRLRKGEKDLRKASPMVIAGRRNWSVKRVAKVLGVTEKEIFDAECVGSPTRET